MKIITLTDYAMGRDAQYPDEWKLAEPYAIKFLEKINAFMSEMFPDLDFQIHSGFRPAEINATIPGAALHSWHTKGRAVDLADEHGFFKQNLKPITNQAHADMLRKHGLFMEAPQSTPTWCHLDDGDRFDRPSRVFFIK